MDDDLLIDKSRPTPLDPTTDVNATVELHRLCEECKCIGRTLPSSVARLREQGSEPWEIQFQHYGKVAALRESIKNGCHLCAKMWKSIGDKKGTMQRQNYKVSLLFRQLRIHGEVEDHVSLVIEDGQNWLGSLKLRRSNSCRSHARSQFPTRLIDVGPSDESTLLRLRESDFGAEARYTALSYCWGKVDTLKLTKETYRDLLAGIEMDLLPRTYRDAVVITRKLGFQYLWVDALCILQDSKEDWERESTKMSDVYSGSVVTIGAVWGKDSNAGLFVQRDTLSQWPCKVVETPDETFFAPSQEPTFGTRADWAGSWDLRRRKPLFTRGWALQERFLSTRTLFYGSDELHWECHTGQASEIWPKIGESIYPVGGVLGNSRDQQMTLKSFGELPSMRNPLKDIMLDLPYLKTFFSNWNVILQRYWRTSLTYPTDGLVALSGITQYIETLTGLTFYAGAWLELLLFDLLWWKDHGKVCERVSCNPSWSWAGTSGGTTTLSPGGVSFVLQSNHDTTYFSKFRPCEPKGALEISGLVLHTQLSDTLRDSKSHTLPLIEKFGLAGAFLEIPHPGRLLDVVCLLLVQWRNEHPNYTAAFYHSEGLILVPINEKTDEYQRIGLWTLRNKHDNRTAVASEFKHGTITLV